MIKYQITIGLNDKITKKQEIPTAEAHEKINKILLDYFQIFAFTKFDCFGCYKHDNGEIVQEASIRIEIATDKEMHKTIYTIVRAFKRIFNQESIMTETEEKKITF